MRKPLDSLAHAFAALCWSLALAVLGLEILVRFDPLSAAFLRALDVPARVPNALALHEGVMGFLLGRGSLPGGFGPKEAAHFADVAALLTGLRWAGLAALALALALALLRAAPGLVGRAARDKATGADKGKARRSGGKAANHSGGSSMSLLTPLARDLRLGALLLPALLTGLALSALEWPLFFTAFHPLLFPGGGYNFNPHVHLIVRLYPKDYFAWMAATLVAVTGLLALAALLAARLRAGPAEQGRWRPGRAAGLALGAGLVLAAPAFYAGRHSLTPLAPCFLAYYFTSAALVAGSVLLWATRARGLGAAVVLAALLAYGGLDLGLRETQGQAMETMRKGELLVQAIHAHARLTGRLPPSLAALVPAQTPFLPPVLVAGSEWRYRPREDRFFLGFVGPLGYHFQYASHTGRWKWLEL